MLPPMSWTESSSPASAAQRLEQRLGGEHVVAHRRVRHVRVVRQAGRVRRLLQERSMIRPSGVGVDDAERVASARGTRMPATVTAGPGLDVLLDHLPRVHPVDVVGAEHDDVVGLLVVDQVERLEDRVGAAGVPARAEPLLGRHRGDVVAEEGRHPPGLRDVPVQRVRLVLGQHADPQVAGVDQVGQHEVDRAGSCRRTAPPAWPGPRSAARAVFPRHPRARCPRTRGSLRHANRPYATVA